MHKYKLSWCNWSVSDKNETASILKKGAGISNWEEYMITPSGKLRDEMRKKNSLVLMPKKK